MPRERAAPGDPVPEPAPPPLITDTLPADRLGDEFEDLSLDGLGPGEPPEAPSFSWSIDDAEEVHERSPSRRWIVWGSAAVILSVLAVVGALLFSGTPGKSSASPARPTALAPSAASTVVVGPRELYTPRNLTIGTAQGRYQITWEPPERIGDIAGYLVVAQSPQGVVRTQQLLKPAETSAVFTTSDVARDSCFVVGALVRNGAEPLSPIGTEPVCL